MTSRRFSRMLWFCVAATLCLGGALAFVPQARTMGQAPTATITPSHGRPLVNLRNPQSLKIDYTGSADVVSALKADATPTTLAAGDFDADGAPDLVTGYRTSSRRSGDGAARESGRLRADESRSFPGGDTGQCAGDVCGNGGGVRGAGVSGFSRRRRFQSRWLPGPAGGHQRGRAVFAGGDGHGSLGKAQAVALTGAVRALDVLPDGHVAVSVEGPEGPQVVILAPGTQGLSAVAAFPTPAVATSLGGGSLGAGRIWRWRG
jgi:hypothetical protein